MNTSQTIEDLTKKLSVAEFKLREREKELACLYSISTIVESNNASLPDLLQEIANVLPSAMQHSDIASAKISYNNATYLSGKKEITGNKLFSEIKVSGHPSGSIEVFYPSDSKYIFLQEEVDLINSVSERLGRIIERKLAQEALTEKTHELEKFNSLMVGRELKMLELKKEIAELRKHRVD